MQHIISRLRDRAHHTELIEGGCSQSRDFAEAADEIERLREMLASLSNEVLGGLPLIEQQARQDMGHTNYGLLILRAEEARKHLGAHPWTKAAPIVRRTISA